MADVRVTIMPEGFALPISFLQLVRTHLDLPLVEAKRVLDTLATDKSVTVLVASEPTARAFADAVKALDGLVATITSPVEQGRG